MDGLKEACRNKFKVMFQNLKAQTNAMTFILVTDESTLKILSSFMKMMELVNYGITAIQKLTLIRKRFHKIQAIYLLSENPDSVDRLLKDYQTEDDAQYGSVHIFFTTRIASNTLDRIASNQILLKRVKTFKQLNLEFICATNNEFILDIFPNSDSFNSLYAGSGALYRQQQRLAIERMATIVTSFPKFYSVQIFYNSNPFQKVGQRIAKGLQGRLADLFQHFSKGKCINFDPKAPKITLLVLDRSYDPGSPLLHDFHYLSLLADLKGITQFKTQYNDGQGKPKLLEFDEQDHIYMKYRYRHIAQITSGVAKQFQQFLKSNSAAKLEQGDMQNLNAARLGELMKKIPQYNQAKQRFSLHIKLVTEVFDAYKQRGLLTVGELQQTIVTGVGPKGAPQPDKIIYNNLLAHLSKQKDIQVKARLLVLALIYLDMGTKERSDVDKMLHELGYTNITQGVAMLTGGKPLLKLKQSKQKSQLILDRHIPKVQSILNDILNRGVRGDLLSVRINDDKSGDRSNMLVRKKIGRQDQAQDLPKIVVYMVGGIGFNQIRCVNKFSDRYTVVSGSNRILSPSDYLKELNVLTIPGQAL